MGTDSTTTARMGRDTMQPGGMMPGIAKAVAALALALAACGVLCLAACPPAPAWADDPPEGVPASASGTCYIGDTWMVGSDSFFTVPAFSGLLSGCVPSSSFECLNHTAAAPEHVDATYEARLVGYSLEGGWVEYYVTITPPDATDGVTRNELGLTGYQRVGGTVRLAWDFCGAITLQKRSANASVTDGNACYGLSGAIYGVYSTREAAATHSGDAALRTCTTAQDGSWTTASNLTVGTYYVAEVSAPKGYALDSSVYAVEVQAGKTAAVNGAVGHVADAPVTNPVTLWATKRDAQTPDGSAQGSATLEGAQFTISYYDGYYEAGNLPAEPARTWVVATGPDGKATVDDAHRVGGDAYYRTSSGQVTIPLGTVTVRETSAPSGYLTGTRDQPAPLRVFKITASGSSQAVDCYSAPQFSDDVARGGVAIGKVDRQNGGFTPQGAADLEGCEFAIANASERPVYVNGTSYAPGQVVAVLESKREGGSFIARSEPGLLPVGSYVVYESKAGTGYLRDAQSQQWSRRFDIAAEGAVADLTGTGDAASNLVVRGDIAFSKVDGQTAARMAGVPFMVESQTTGERHVIVTDENGMFSSAANWNAHSTRTNVNDHAVTTTDEGVVVDEAQIDPAAGTWFSGSADIACAPDDSLGALPYDTYTVTELRAKANEGYELATFSVSISRDGRELDLGTVDDNSGPIVNTSLADDNGVKLVAAETTATVTDQVSFTNLDMRQQYTLVGTMHRVNDDGTDGGVVAEASRTFEPSGSTGTVGVEFAVDTTDLEGARLVAFETLLNAQGATIATHEDLLYEGQTVRVPEIRTTLADATDGDHEASAESAVTLVDTVEYRGLTPGDAYTLLGTLHLRGDDGEDAGAAVDAQGRPITARASFVASEEAGSVEVSFTFAAPELAGKSVVAFEELVRRDQTYAAHADISDEGQTVAFAPREEPEQPAGDQPETPTGEKPGTPDEPRKTEALPIVEDEKPAPEPAPTAPKKAKLAQTGDALNAFPLVFAAAGALGLGCAALAVRRMRRDPEIRIERGRPRV